VQAICGSKSGGCSAGSRLNRLLLEVGGPDGLADGDAAALGLVEALTPGELDAPSAGLGDGDPALHAVSPTTNAITAEVTASRWIAAPWSATRAG
jgi:hypothetical protein